MARSRGSWLWPQMACVERPGFTSQELEAVLGPGAPTDLTAEIEAAFHFVEGGQFMCYEFDTGPPELRRGPCNPDFDRLGAPRLLSAF